MRPVLSPRKKARKKDRKKVDRTKTRFQVPNIEDETDEILADTEFANALLESIKQADTGKTRRLDDIGAGEEPVAGPEDPPDEEEPNEEDYLDYKGTKELDGINDAPLPFSSNSQKPKPESD